MPVQSDFQLEADAEARAWLSAHPSPEPRLIAFEVKHCCGGGRICTVRVRERSRTEDVGKFATALLEDGTRFMVDPRAAARLPSRFALRMRGLGRFRHLDLELTGDQWGALLYD